MTTDQREAPERPAPRVPVPVRLVLPARDVRQKRPAVFAFVLRLETLRRTARVVSLLALDFCGVLAALYSALWVKDAIKSRPALGYSWGQTQHWLVFAYLLVVLTFAHGQLYAERTRRPGLSRIIAALFQAAVIGLVFALANGDRFQSYYVFGASIVFGSVYISGLRELHLRVTGWVLERAGYRRRALLVGTGGHIEAVAQALADRAHTPVDVIGYISLEPSLQNGKLRSFGDLTQLADVLEHEQVQEVIIADSDFPQERAVELVDRCHRRGVTVHVAPTTMEILMDRAEFVPGMSVPLFTLRPPVFEGVDFALKRSFDLVVSTLTLILLSPLLLIISLAVKLSSPGPIVYRSMRPGMAGKPFFCFKFRTMRHNAEDIQSELEPLNEMTGAIFKIRHDPRLTPVGRLLRRFSLDELPQLVNVLRGEMSLVGPRPLPMRDFERLEDWHKKRYLVLPGITGLWQVSGRAELDFDDLVRLDFLYLEEWSLLLDLTILLRTIPAVITRRGAF